MKSWLCAFLSFALLLGAFALAEEEWDDSFGFDDFDDGYEGSWVQVEALGIEFCLPEGWHATDAPKGAAYAAASAQGDATLAIRLAAENVDDLFAWGAANLENSQPDTSSFYDVLLTGGRNALSVYLIVSGDDVLSFDFTRANEDALSPEFALGIVGSSCALWDDDVSLMDGDEGFDFWEAFEEDLA